MEGDVLLCGTLLPLVRTMMSIVPCSGPVYAMDSLRSGIAVSDSEHFCFSQSGASVH